MYFIHLKITCLLSNLLFFIITNGCLFGAVNFEGLKKEITMCVDSLVYQHIKEKFKAAVVHNEPFPHIVIENFLPQELYNYGIEKWPVHELFNQQANPRQFLWVNFGCLKNSGLDLPSQIFWQTFGEVVINQYTKPLIIQKLKPYLDIKFQTKDQKKLKYIEEELKFWDSRQDGLVMYPSTNELAPHFDECNVFAQILLYFPSDDLHEEVGTTFYSGSAGLSLKDKSVHNNDLKIAKKIPYRRNTLVVFMQSPISWHSVDAYEYPGENYLRKLYLASVALSPECIEKVYEQKIPFSPIDLYLHEHLLLNIKELR